MESTLTQQLQSHLYSLDSRPGSKALDPDVFIGTIIEHWRRHRHYYRIPVSQIPYLSAIDLGDIPSSAFILPPGIEAVRFEFDGRKDIQYAYASYAITEKSWSLITRYGEFVSQIYFQRDDATIESHLRNAFLRGPGDPVVTGTALKQSVERSEEDYEEMRVQADVMRLIVNVLMLRECNPTFFKPDILSADRSKYDEAKRRGDENAVAVIEERAKRRKGVGFVFDSGEDWEIILGELGSGSGRPTPETTQERTRCWIRRGHWRRVHYGKGNVMVKWRFFPPQVCRPDLAEAHDT